MTRLLGPAELRKLAEKVGVRPAKRLGQNFVHDANTVRRIVAAADLTPDDVVLEVGPGLGSLTLALLGAVDRVLGEDMIQIMSAVFRHHDRRQKIAVTIRRHPLLQFRRRAGEGLIGVLIEDDLPHAGRC